MEAHLVGTIVALLLVACLIALLAEWIRLPYTIALVCVGLVIALTKLTPSIVISKEVVFHLLLPPLLFQGALHMDLERLKNNWRSILMLSIPGVVCSTLLIGFLLHRLWGIDLMYGLLFGALITPTDPISVLAILKRVGAPERLRVILEGESLFNDGTGVVIFSVILGMVTGCGSFELGHTVLEFLMVAGGGVVIGALLGYGVYRLLKKIENHLVEVTLTVVLAFGTPLLAEAFHFSGIIAVVVAGLVIGNYGRIFSMSEKTRDTVETFWEVIDFIINSLVFLVIGIELQVITLADFEHLWVPVLVGILAVLLARIVVVYPIMGILHKIGGASIPGSWAHVVFWGGLKGSIPIALVVGMSPSLEHRHLFLTASFAIVLVSLVFQGITMKPLIQRLGLSHQT